MHAILLIVISERVEKQWVDNPFWYLILKIPKKETSHRTVFQFLIHCFGGPTGLILPKRKMFIF